MAKHDIFGDEVAQESNSFETAFGADVSSKKLKVGDVVHAEILTMGSDESFVSLGGAIDGQLATRELLDSDRKPKFKVGDVIPVVIVRFGEGEIRVRRQDARTSSAETESLEDAMDMELPVEGKVTEAVKGGFRVSIKAIKAFCPISQIDLKFATDPNEYVGKKFDFLVTQIDESQRNIIVSRRKLLELQRAEHEGELLKKIQPGDIVEGVVSRMEAFGAFINIGSGVEGLVHISEVSWSRLRHASEVLTAGQPVRVKVLKIEDADGRLRISMSLKQGGSEADPWSTIATDFPVGKQIDGTVEKKEVYGLFVNVAPGITGLLPKSKWRDSLESAQYEGKKKGDAIRVQVDQVDTQERRLSLGIPGEKYDDSWKAHSGEGGAGSKGLGTFAELFQQASKKTTR